MIAVRGHRVSKIRVKGIKGVTPDTYRGCRLEDRMHVLLKLAFPPYSSTNEVLNVRHEYEILKTLSGKGLFVLTNL